MNTGKAKSSPGPNPGEASCARSPSPRSSPCVALPSFAAERWETLPPTPAPIATDRGGEAEANGIKIHYAIYGQGSPVICLHGGLANTDYWATRFPQPRRIIP